MISRSIPLSQSSRRQAAPFIRVGRSRGETGRKFVLAIFAAFALLGSVAASFAQVPGPVPALPDAERRTSYSITASTCACSLGANMALFGDSNDYWNWVEVWLNGVRVNYNDATFGWTITSPSGPLANLARPITDAVLTFTNPQTGTVQIVGARRPRRVSQFSESAGVPARNVNQVVTDITATLREMWDKSNDVTGRALLSQPGVTLGLLPLPSVCQNGVLGFDSTGLNPVCTNFAGFGSVGANRVWAGPSSGPNTLPTFRALVGADLPLFTTTLNGAVPNPGTATGKVLSDSGAWISAGGTGTVQTLTAGTGISLSSGSTCTTNCTVSANALNGAYNPVVDGVVCDGVTDVGTQINTSLANAKAAGKYWQHPGGNCRFSIQLNNTGVSMRGCPATNCELQPLASFPAATSLLLVQPPASADNTMLEISYLFIQPNVGGVLKGGKGIDFEWINSGSGSTQNAAQIWVHHNFVLPGNDYSLVFSNGPNSTSGNNCQGIPATSTIENNLIFEGMNLIQIGDSNAIRHNTIRADGPRSGINVFQVNCVSGPVQGNAGWTLIKDNNISNPAACIFISNGHSVKIRDNECEGTGSGSASGALIDIDGSSGVCALCEVTGNLISALGGGTAAQLLRLNGTLNNVVENNTFTNGQASLTNDILITASSTNARISYNNLTTFNTTNQISDAGVGTVGVKQVLSANTGWSNTGSGFDTFNCIAALDGTVALGGLLNASGVTSGSTIATLPVQCRPNLAMIFPGYIPGVAGPVELQLNTTGVLTVTFTGSLTQLSLNGITFRGTQFSSGNN